MCVWKKPRNRKKTRSCGFVFKKEIRKDLQGIKGVVRAEGAGTGKKEVVKASHNHKGGGGKEKRNRR